MNVKIHMDDVSNKGSSKNTYASRGDQPKYELLSQIILLDEIHYVYYINGLK